MSDQEPNPLDQPGKPLIAKVQAADGTWSPQEIPRTKGDNCADAAYDARGLDKVTPKILKKWGVSKVEYAEFAMDEVRVAEALEIRRQSDKLLSSAEKGDSRWWARSLGCLGVLGGGLLGAIVGGTIGSATCEPDPKLIHFIDPCLGDFVVGVVVGFVVGLLAGVLLWVWLASRSSHDRR